MERPEDFNCYDNEREFVAIVRQGIIDKLENDWKGQEKEASDIGFLLTENENVDGSWYCNTWKAEQDLSWFFSVFIKYQEWWENNYGEPLNLLNDDGSFDSERIHCCMMIDAYRNCFDRAFSKIEDDKYSWDEKVLISDEFIDEMKKAIEENIISLEDIF